MVFLPFRWAKYVAIVTTAHAVIAFHAATYPSRKITSVLSSSAFSGGFDSDRMIALAQRGEFEASLMQASAGVLGEATTITTPTTTTNTKKKKKKKIKKKKKSPSIAMIARTLGRDGVVKLDGILSPNTVCTLRHEILERRDAALLKITGQGDDADDDNWKKYFADVLLKGHQGQRCDLLLPLAYNPVLQTALYELLVSSNLLYNTLVNALGGDDITLYELASLISEPGSLRQPVHPDNPHQEFPPLLTVFVALQAITPAMGPTNFIPRSHTADAHAAFNHNDITRRNDLLQNSHSVLALLQAGDASLFDSRTLHCGGANDMEEGATRVLLYMSFQNPRATEPIGNVGSIMPGIEQITLRDLRNKLIQAEKNRADMDISSSSKETKKNSFVDPFDNVQATDALAQLKLGNNYYVGSGGVETNYEEAVKWFQLASDQGLPQASFNLGVCYFEGKGVPRQDLNRALELFTVAAKGGHPGAKEAGDEVLRMLEGL